MLLYLEKKLCDLYIDSTIVITPQVNHNTQHRGTLHAKGAKVRVGYSL